MTANDLWNGCDPETCAVRAGGDHSEKCDTRLPDGSWPGSAVNAGPAVDWVARLDDRHPVGDTRPISYTSCGFESCQAPATGFAPVFYGEWLFENRSACDAHGSDGTLKPSQLTESEQRLLDGNR